MRKFVHLLALSAIAMSPTVLAAKKQPTLTPMEIQALQSKDFDTTKAILFASVMSVFQDLGYQADSADVTTGFITANSATRNKTGLLEAFAGMSASGNSRVTAYIEEIGNRSRVRLNFLNSKTSSSAYGQSAKEEKPVLDPQTYSVAWQKIDEAIFIRSATASPNAGAREAVATSTSPTPAATLSPLPAAKPTP